MHGVRARLAHPRQQCLSGTERQRKPAGERDRKDAERETGHVAPPVRPDGEEERGCKRRRVQRVCGTDRHDEGDERKHPCRA